MLQGNSGTSKIRVLLSGTPHPNSGADVVVNETRRRSSLRITPTTVERVVAWMHKVYYTLVDCNPVTPLLRFVLDSLYNLFLHCCAAVSTDTSRRAVRLRWQNFLFSCRLFHYFFTFLTVFNCKNVGMYLTQYSS